MTDINDALNAKAEEQQELRDAEKWEPEAGDVLNGVIMKTGWYDQSTEYDPSMFLIFKDIDNDESVTVWPKTVLMGQLMEEQPAIGQHIAIRYEGRVESGSGRMYHNYIMVLVPDAEGSVKRDPAYWFEHGHYRGEKAAQASRDAVTGDDKKSALNPDGTTRYF